MSTTTLNQVNREDIISSILNAYNITFQSTNNNLDSYELYLLFNSYDVTISKCNLIPPYIKLLEWDNDILEYFEHTFNTNIILEDVEMKRLLVVELYTNLYINRYGRYDGKILNTSTISICDIIDMLHYTKKDTNIIDDVYHTETSSISDKLEELTLVTLVTLYNSLK